MASSSYCATSKHPKKGITMKLAMIGLLAAGLASTATAAIELTLDNPRGFRDFEIRTRTAEAVASVFQAEFERAAEHRLNAMVPEGHTLELTVTDIDMAGEIQPSRNMNHPDIRYVESNYPPRMTFNYRLVDAEGNEVSSGQEHLRDLTFDLGAPKIGRDNTFRYEIALIEDWMQDNIRSIAENEKE